MRLNRALMPSDNRQRNTLKALPVRKVGYHKAGYTVQQIAPMFKDADGLKNVLLSKEILNELNTKEV